MDIKKLLLSGKVYARNPMLAIDYGISDKKMQELYNNFVNNMSEIELEVLEKKYLEINKTLRDGIMYGTSMSTYVDNNKI